MIVRTKRLCACAAAILWAALIVPPARAEVLLSEGFDGGGFPPSGWTAVNQIDAGPVVWDLNTAFGEQNWTGGGGEAAMVDSFSFFEQRYDAWLVTPVIGLPTDASGLELSFLTVLEPWSGDETADVDVSTNGGLTWTNLLRWNVLNPVEGLITVPLAAYQGSSARFRFRYHNHDSTAWDNFWQIDEVLISSSDLIMGDADASGYVGDNDLSLVLANWSLDTDWAHGNFNNDSVVNDDDMSLLLAHWNEGAAPTGGGAAPEPVSLAILAVGAVGLLRRTTRTAA